MAWVGVVGPGARGIRRLLPWWLGTNFAASDQGDCSFLRGRNGRTNYDK